VDAWLERVGARLSRPALVDAFDEAFTALWRRARQTLGDVTLTAILDRVLHTAAERHAAFSKVKITASGLDCRALRGRARAPAEADLREGMRFMLCEFLSVLGKLTAEILTPSLHEELAKLAPATPRRSTRRGPKASPGRGGPDEDA